MRRIGTLETATQAERFCDYLLTEDIEATFDPADAERGGCDIWVKEESQLDRGKALLADFQEAPESTKYQVKDQVQKLREAKVAEHQRRQKNLKQFKGRSMPGGGMGGRLGGGNARQSGIPITLAIIVLSVVASFAANMGRGDFEVVNVLIENNGVPRQAPNLSSEAQVSMALSFVDRFRYVETNGDSLASIKQGQIWRVFTPMFLHGSALHLAFNMLWIYMLGSALERLHGSATFGALVLFTHAVGMIVQVFSPEWFPEPLRGSPFVVGASGAVYGLFGFLWIRPKVEPMYPIAIPPQNVVLMLGWLVACMTPLISGVANGAHLGGLIGGVIAAVVLPSKMTG